MWVTRTTGGAAAATRRGGRVTDKGFRANARADGASAGVGATGVLGSIDALAALQAVDGAHEDGTATATAFGAALLDDLAALRDALLEEEVDDKRLNDLRARLGRRRPAGLDANLDRLLDDIELRAAVELAKRERKPNIDAAAPGTSPTASDPLGADLAARALRAYGGGKAGG